MAITVSNRGAITERPTVAVHNIAAAAGISTDTVPPIVTQNKHRSRRPASGDGSGTGIPGFVPVSEHKRDVTERRLPPPWIVEQLEECCLLCARANYLGF